MKKQIDGVKKEVVEVKKHNRTQKKITRRNRVIQKLEFQLTSKVKVPKDGSSVVALTEQDVERIKKELVTLKTRI